MQYGFTYYKMTEPVITRAFENKHEWVEAVKDRVYRLNEAIFIFLKSPQIDFSVITVTKQISEIIEYVESDGADYISIFEADTYDEVLGMLKVIFENLEVEG